MFLFPLLSIQGVTLADSGNDGNQEDYEGGEETENIENVIMMIGDGLGMGQLEIARALEHGKEDQFHMEQLEDIGLMQTYSHDNHVTDSAAAGTAIANSQKTNNGMVGMTPDGEPVQSIMQAFQEDGKKTGAVVNHSITDATPAAFTAHVKDRDQHEDIARQQYENQYDVLLGGGLEYFLPEAQDGVDLTEAFEDDGYQFVETREELMNIDHTDQLLGLFADEHMALETDIDLIEEDQPSLSEMSEVALDTLEHDEDGFFLMIEGARIDHAAHYADATSVWKEMVEFDDTVEYVKEWAEERDDTLLVVTSDHETMGMSMTEVMDVEALREVSASPEYMIEEFNYDEENERFTEESIQSIVSEHAGFELSNEDMERLNNHLYEDDGTPKDEWDQAVELGLVIAEHYNVDVFNREITEKSTSTSGHSGNMVPIFASGTGSDQFNGVIDNTDLSKIIADQAGIEFESTSSEGQKDTTSGYPILHDIVWGDTLSELAQNHQTTVETLTSDNDINNPDKIYAGDELKITPPAHEANAGSDKGAKSTLKEDVTNGENNDGTKTGTHEEFLNIAHRGASGHAPEHTIASYDKAVEMDSDYLELDVQITADNELVVFHDDEIDRTTNGEGEIGDHTLEELKELDAGSWFNQKYPQQSEDSHEYLEVLTLEEVFDEYGQDENYYIETKSPTINEGMEKPLVNTVEEYDLNDNVIIQSFSPESLKEIHNLNDDIPLVQLLSYEVNKETGKTKESNDITPNPENMTTEDFENIREYAIGIGPNFIDDETEVFNKDFVQKTLNHNLLIHPYTINEKEDMERLIDWGVTGIFTDYPNRLNTALENDN